MTTQRSHHTEAAPQCPTYLFYRKLLLSITGSVHSGDPGDPRPLCLLASPLLA